MSITLSGHIFYKGKIVIYNQLLAGKICPDKSPFHKLDSSEIKFSHIFLQKFSKRDYTQKTSLLFVDNKQSIVQYFPDA